MDANSKEIHHIRIDGVINPVSANFIISSLENATDQNVECLIIELDTPGGLLEATRDIVQKFLASETPIIVYVSPSGARAGSAGVFITLSAHIAAMTPGSNIGAAHPVTMGGGGMPGSDQKPDSINSSVLNEKMTNDAAALIRAIAEQRNRNIEWAESSVRESVSITAKAALELDVIDLIAVDLDSLIIQLDGLNVSLASNQKTLSTIDAPIVMFEMDWRERIFNRIADPNIAYIFMMLGTYGLIFELSNPGSIFPGIIGGICLLLAFLAFQTLPINTVGLLLILFGIILLLLEIKVNSFGMLATGGALSLILGSTILVDTEIPALKVTLDVILPTVGAFVLFVIWAISMGLKAQSKKPHSGTEGIIGEIGEALDDIDPKGKVFVHGEYWQAKSKIRIAAGEDIKVIDIRGMILIVEKVELS